MRPPSASAGDPCGGDRRRQQRHGVEALRGLADDLRDLLRRGPAAEQFAGPAVAAGRRHHRRGQVADAGQAGEGLELGAAADRVVGALAPDLGGGDPGRVQPVRLGRGGGERGGVLRGAGHLDAGDVAGALADQAGTVEDLAELAAQVGVGGAEHQGGRAGDRLARVRGAAEAGDRPGADPLADVFGGELSEGRDQALGQQQHRCPLADPVGDRAHRLREGAGGDREADEVEAGELDLARLAHAQRARAAPRPGR